MNILGLIFFALINISSAQVSKETLRDIMMLTAPGSENLIQTSEKTSPIGDSSIVVTKIDDSEKLKILDSFSTPRKSIEYFIDSMNSAKVNTKRADDYLNQAILVLDLSNIEPSIKISYGKQIAEKLIFIFDRLKEVKLSNIPNMENGEKWIYSQIDFNDGTGIIKGEIALEKINGYWKFNSKTIQSVDFFYQEAAKRPLLESAVEDNNSISRAKHFFATFGTTKYLFFTLGQWLGIAGILVLSFILGTAVKVIINLYLKYIRSKRIFHFSQNEIDKIFLPIKLLVFSSVWLTGINFINLSQNVYANASRVFYILFALSLVWVLMKLVDVSTTHFKFKAAQTVNKFDDTIVPMLSRTAKILVVVLGSIFVAHAFTFDVRGLLAGLGLGGIAIALASKDTIANLFATVTVIIDRPFQIGDYIYVGNFQGTVEDLGFRSTRIRTPERSLLSIPNSTIANMAIDNYGARYSRRFKTTLQVDINAEPGSVERFCKKLRESLAANTVIDQESVSIYLKEIKDKAMNVYVSLYIKTVSSKIEAEEVHKINMAIVTIAEKIQLELLNNNNTVVVKNENQPAI